MAAEQTTATHQVNITYDKLFEILRSEKNNPDLQKLPEQFISDLVNYLALKNQTLSGSSASDFLSASQQDMTQQQLKNALRIVSEILDRREKKIVLIALNKSRAKTQVIDTQAMLPKEKELFSNLVLLLTNQRTDISNEIMGYKTQAPKPLATQKPQIESNSEITYEATAPIPAFVGPDMQQYGPFEVGDTVTVSEQITKILLKRQQITPKK